jgi:cytochrome c biogenesis protein CcmG/thiol:disulfide interchange protein DsbE
VVARRLLFLLPVLLFLGLGAAFYTGLGRDPRLVPSALIDEPAPEFELPPVAEDIAPGLSSTDLRGQVSLVNFFASWCPPCRVEHPVLMRLAEQGIPVYGINKKDRPEQAVAFLDELGNPYARIGADPSGRASIDWGVYGLPETFIVGPDGRIAYRHVGPIMPQDVERVILPTIERLRG